MTLAEARQELMNHLVLLRIPRTIEPSHISHLNSAYCVHPRVWISNPNEGLQLFKRWLDSLVLRGHFPEYHELKLESDFMSGVQATLSQGVI